MKSKRSIINFLKISLIYECEILSNNKSNINNKAKQSCTKQKRSIFDQCLTCMSYMYVCTSWHCVTNGCISATVTHFTRNALN